MGLMDIFEVSDIRGYIKDLGEDTLIENVIIPLYQKRNFRLIGRPAHGPGEHGKDLIFMEDNKTSFKLRFHAIQAKSVKINTSNVSKIIDQTKAAFEVPFIDPHSNNDTKVDYVQVITSGNVTNDARIQFTNMVSDKRYITLLDGEQLIDLIEETKRNFCKTDESQTNTTAPPAKIPSNASLSAEISKIGEAKLLPGDLSTDVKKFIEKFKKGIPDGTQIVKVEETKFSEKIPLDARKGELLISREIIDTTRVSIIPSLLPKSEYIGEAGTKERQPPSLELSQKIKSILESLSGPERKVVDILNYCNGIDEKTLKCIIGLEDINENVLEALKRKDIINYNEEKLTLPASISVKKVQIINGAQYYFSQLSQTGKKEINSSLIKALNVCNESVPLILSIIDKKYDEIDGETRNNLLKYILQNRNDKSIAYFASRFSNKESSLIKLGEEILSKDIEREHDHRTYFNFGSALLSKNTKDGIIIDRYDVDKNQIKNARNLLLIACDMDTENVKYLSTLSITQILLGDFNKGIFNAELALKKNENDINALNSISIGYMFKKNLNAALKYLEKLYEIKPDHVSSLLNLGNVYKGLKRFDKALEVFERANQLEPNKDHIISEIGVAHQNLGNVDNAINAFDKAIELNPTSELAWLGKGDLYFNNLKDHSKAVEFYEKASKINEKNPNTWVALAQSYDRLDDHEKANKCIDKALTNKPSSEFALLGLGAFYANRGVVKECSKWCGKLIRENNINIKALECIGVAYNNAKKFEKAIEYFNKALDINPTQFNIIYEKAMATNALKHTEEAKQLYHDLLKLDPNNINTLLELSKILSNEGNYDKALKLLSRAEKKSPDDSDLLLIKGTVYANKKDYVKAVEYLDRSLKLNPKNVYVWLNLGRIYVNTFNGSKSREYFEKGLELEPDNVFLLEGLGVSCLNLRLFNDAINKFERIIKLEPSYTSAYFYIAEAYKLKGDSDLSINYYDELLELEPSNRNAILGKCNVYISSGKMPSAKKLFKKLMKESGGDAQVPFDISVVLNKCEKFEDSIRYLNKAIDTNSKREIFYIEKANIYHKLGKYKEADKSYKKALSINPKSSTVLYHIGINYLAKKNLRKAIEFLKKYTVIVPNDATAWFNLGKAYNKQGNKNAAKECFESSIQYGPLNAEMFSVIGDFYNQIMGDINNAITCYEKAISHGRSDSRIKTVLATCYLNLGKHDKCIRYCEDVLNKEPENIDALIFENIAWSFKGQNDITDEKLRKALLLQPNNYLTMLGLAVFNNNQRKEQEAIKWAKKGVEIEPHNPNNVILHLILGSNYNSMRMYKEAIANFESAKKYKPDYEDVLKSGGFPFRNLKRYHEAIEWWKEYLKLKPEDWEYWYYTGVTYGDINDFENGIECLEKAISLNDTEKGPYYAIGIQYSKSGNHHKAIQIFEKLKTLDPESNEPLLHIGDIYFTETNEFEKAIAEYLEAMKINSNNWKAWVNLSVASRILGDIAKEKEYIDKAIQQCPDKIELFLREINLFLRLKRITDAERSVDNALIEFPENHIMWFLKACVASLNMDVDESIKALEKAISLNPECINLAQKEPNLEFLRTQKSFTDLIEENTKK